MDLDRYWRRAAPLISPALDATHGLADVAAGVSTGLLHLWPGERAAAVCEFVRHPRLTDYHVWLAGGSLRELIAMERAACVFARKAGCDRITINGRPGWGRVLKGYRLDHVVLIKELK